MTDDTKIDQPAFKMFGISLSAGDFIKALFFIISAVVLWEGNQSQLANISQRLDRIESSQNIYLRTDLQAERDSRLTEELAAVRDRLERLERKIDRSDRINQPTQRDGN